MFPSLVSAADQAVHILPHLPTPVSPGKHLTRVLAHRVPGNVQTDWTLGIYCSLSWMWPQHLVLSGSLSVLRKWVLWCFGVKYCDSAADF